MVAHMILHQFALFETAIGTCGIVWIARGVAGVQLPEANEAATHARVRRCFAGAQEAEPPPNVQCAMNGIVALLRGERPDFGDVEMDFGDLPEFNLKVYDIARAIPWPNNDLWRNRRTAWRQFAGTRGRPSARAKPNPAHCPLPPRVGGRR